MALLPNAIRTSEHTRSTPDGTPLPAGIYSGTVAKTEQKETNNKDGLYVRVEINIDTPEEFNKRKFWDDFNIVNASEVAAKIGTEALADLGKAAGIDDLVDDEQLQGRSVLMELYIDKGGEYKDKQTGAMKMGKDKNKCRKYWPIGTDVEAAKKAEKDAKKGLAAPGNTQAVTQAAVAKPAAASKPKFPGTGSTVRSAIAEPAAAAPVAAQATQPVAAAAAPGAARVSPWKRNKQ